jgi:hypothetical protein
MQPAEWTPHGIAVEVGESYAIVQRKLANVQPCRVEGKKKFYRLTDIGHLFFHRAGDPEVLGFEEARNRKLTAEAKLAEYLLAEKQAVMMDVREVKTELDRTFTNIRAKLLAIPSKYAPVVSPADPAKAQRLLEQAIHETLIELQQPDPDPDDDAPDAADATPTGDR